MPDKPLALLLALTAGNAFAAVSHFSDPVPEKADGVPLAYIGQDTHSAIPLNLSQKPNGGKIIGSLAQGRPLRVLLVDNKGNHLIRASSGLTGWAQPGKGDDSETFPALTTAKDDTATIHYHPELGTPQDIHYYPQGEAVIGKPDADKPGIPPITACYKPRSPPATHALTSPVAPA